MSTTRHTDLLLRPLRTPDDLHRWVRLFCNLDVPRTPVMPGSTAPFDYIRRAYFEPASDQVVHACRGGGKTRLAAVVTLLDLLHKPGISIRILGGSLEQSMRMWEHLLPDLTHSARDLIKRRTGNARRITLSNGSSCAVLTQSERSIRGVRVQKLRCDEVDVFSPDVWEAAQLVTRSASPALTNRPDRGAAGAIHGAIHGAIDALSTLHKPFGLMQQVVENAEAIGTPVVRWNLIDVLEKCPVERECASCPLLSECGGVAKTRCSGFLKIDDAIRMKARVSSETWKTEMLCERPVERNAVYSAFDPAIHVMPDIGPRREAMEMSLAIDFGFAAAFVCLWVMSDDTTTYIVDEFVSKETTTDQNIAEIRKRPWPHPTHIDCDPAGMARNDQTGASNVTRLRQGGFVVRYRTSQVMDGVEMIRAALQPASGTPTLFIHPRCKRLIRSLTCLRFQDLVPARKRIVKKDGEHDHAADALRYYFVNRGRRGMGKRTY